MNRFLPLVATKVRTLWLQTYIHATSVDAHLWTEPKHKRARLESVVPGPVPPPMKQAAQQQQQPVATPLCLSGQLPPAQSGGARERSNTNTQRSGYRGKGGRGDGRGRGNTNWPRSGYRGKGGRGDGRGKRKY
jgi:hypothetical protein